MKNTLILNFLPIISNPDTIILHEKEVFSQESRERGLYRITQENGKTYDVSFSPREGFEPKTFKLAEQSVYLALYYLNKKIALLASELFESRITARSKPLAVYRDICITLESLRYGKRVMRIIPKALNNETSTGIVIREEYWKNREVQHGRATMIEEGTYDSKGAPNVAYHQEAWSRIKKFMSDPAMIELLTRCHTDDGFEFSKSFQSLSYQLFASREFQVGNKATCRNVLSGVSSNGPFKTVSDPVQLLFIAREEERVIARTLYAGLINGNDKARPQNLLRFRMDIHPLKFIAVRGFSNTDLQTISNKLLEMPPADRKNTVAVCILPDKDRASYIHLKAALMKHGIPSQCCTKALIASAYSFKWALANIALGIFAKSGGLPWRVSPHGPSATIIGIGQSIERGKYDDIRRYSPIIRHRTFSVLTDSSGQFIKIDDLASGPNEREASYIKDFSSQIEDVLHSNKEHLANDLIVIHTPFNLKHDLTRALEDTIKNISKNSSQTFVVLKFNSASEYWFGFSTENNKIPPEGAYCQISDGEYLIWFEGCDRNTMQAKRRSGAPAHLKFIGGVPSLEVIKRVLQDAYDLAGANWRGFNARGVPVSMYYCKLIADFLKGFHEAGLAPPEIENLNPWFL